MFIANQRVKRMKNVIQLNLKNKLTSNFFDDNRNEFKESAKKLRAIIQDSNKSDISKLEARMIKSIIEFDDLEFERTSRLLNRIKETGLSVVK